MPLQGLYLVIKLVVVIGKKVATVAGAVAGGAAGHVVQGKNANKQHNHYNGKTLSHLKNTKVENHWLRCDLQIR